VEVVLGAVLISIYTMAGKHMSMGLIRTMLAEPSYGWATKETKGKGADAKIYVPTWPEIISEWCKNINVFADRKNWLAAYDWSATFALQFINFMFWSWYISPKLLCAWFLYAMVVMGSSNTLWIHRYATHRAYQFSDGVFGSFAKLLVQNLTVYLVPEEVYVPSHHVHHAIPDQPGDPYHPDGGALYCFLADANHQQINRNLNEHDYQQVSDMLDHVPMYRNTYEQYCYWGTISHPADLLPRIAANWIGHYFFWYMIGGHPLACCILGAAGFWFLGIRTFNFDSHGQGEDRHQEGVDFYPVSSSINQFFPGTVAGEWHNNHHMFPRSARSGFLWWQMDIPFAAVRVLNVFGLVSSFNDDKPKFMKRVKDSQPLVKKSDETPLPFDSRPMTSIGSILWGAAFLFSCCFAEHSFHKDANLWLALICLVLVVVDTGIIARAIEKRNSKQQ